MDIVMAIIFFLGVIGAFTMIYYCVKGVPPETKRKEDKVGLFVSVFSIIFLTGIAGILTRALLKVTIW